MSNVCISVRGPGLVNYHASLLQSMLSILLATRHYYIMTTYFVRVVASGTLFIKHVAAMCINATS